MKKIYYLIAMAFVALTFTSCEDVPSPYGQPINPNATATVDPAGSGTADDPFNIAGAIAKCKEIGDVASTEKYYVKGYAATAATADSQYGNVSFYMTDSQDGKGKRFYAYQVGGSNGTSLTAGYTINVGDEVVIYGPMYNYNGSTPETAGRAAAYIVTVNGESTTGGGGGTSDNQAEAKGSGTQADPYNVSAALNFIATLGADVNSTNEVYIKGKIKSITEEFGTQYGNGTFVMVDDGFDATFTAYRILYLGNKKFTASDTQIKEGDEVIVCGKVVNFRGNTPETVQGSSYLYSLNGKTADSGNTPTPSGEAKGTGTQADPFNAAAANAYIKTLAADTKSESDFYIKGKIVKYANNGEFSAQYGNASFYISDNGTEDGEQFYVFRTLYLGNVKYTEGETPKVGDEVVICGKVVNYKGTTPETSGNESYIFSWNGSSNGGGSGGSGDTSGTGTQASPLSASQVYDAVAAMEKGVTSSEDYWVKGKICSIKYSFSADYGTATFNITDDGNSGSKEFTAYGTYYHAQDQKWTESDTQIQVGDEVLICGKVVNYNGNTPEFASKKSYVVTINGK